MRKSFKAAVSAVASGAMVASLLATPISAYASSASGAAAGASTYDETKWEAPSQTMTNTVEVDGTLYKVITTWANAWALSGADYIGISNSGTMNQNGSGSGSTDLETAQSATMLGIWASSVNEVPNAYNWNYFYNLYADSEGNDTDESLSVIDVANNASPGFDSTSGVWAALKYRPEVIVSSNSMSASSAATYISLINSGSYYTSGTGYSSGSYVESTDTAFSSGTTYYTATTNDDGTTTYTELLTEPDSSTTYYTYDGSAYTECTSLTDFSSGTTYYTATTSDDGTTTYTEVSVSYFDSSTTYYTLTTTSSGRNTVTSYTECTSLSSFESGTTYYTQDDPTYTEVSVSYYDSSKTYYTYSSTVGGTVTDSSGNVVSVVSESSSTSDPTYYISGDESYDPYIVTFSNSSAYHMLDSFYEMAGYAENVITATASYSDSSVTSENVTWKTMNSLPRTTRYEASSENALTARECVLEIEKLIKGAAYYTLAKIADGTVTKKKVAFLTSAFSTTDTSATVVDLEGADSFMGSADTNGKIGIVSLCVESLVTEADVTTGGLNIGSYTTSTASADELLGCDIIWAGNSSADVSDIQGWLSSNATTDELKSAAESISIVSEIPAIMNGHNHTAEKMLIHLYNLSYCYPELFPDLELCAAWYDNVYHVTTSSLSTAMLYGLGNATMPSGTELDSLGGTTYVASDIDTFALEGYKYYAGTLASDTSSVFSTSEYLQPSDDYKTWATSGFVISNGVANISDNYASGTTVTATAVDSSGNSYTLVVDSSGNLTATYTDSSGTVQNLPSGSYTVTVSASGYDEVTMSLIADGSGRITEASVTSGSLGTTTTNTDTDTDTDSGDTTSLTNPVKVKAKTVTVKGKYKKNKLKKAMKVAASKCFKITGNQGGKVSYSPSKITIKKGTKKGKTVSAKVTVKIAKKGDYKAYSKKFTVKIKLK